MIYLLYQSPWPVGGSTSYTVHLKRVLGNAARIVRLGKRTEEREREMSGFGTVYRIMSLHDLRRLARNDTILLTASAPKIDETVWEEMAKWPNVWATFHDPNEFGLYPHWNHFKRDRVISIRQTGLKHMPRSTFIPHPYFPTNPERRSRAPAKHAISIARTSSIKRSDWIMRANRELPAEMRVALHGEMNRMWYAHYLRKHFPEVRPDINYPREWGAGARLCSDALFMVDLTVFKNDGGGTQYTLLEAMDGGAVPIMSKEWCSYPGPAHTFGPAVGSVAELVATLKRHRSLPIKAQREQNYKYLHHTHGVERIRNQYLKLLGG